MARLGRPARSAHVITRLVVTGSECTGKTALSSSLARHYGVGCTSEFVREYAERRGRPIAESDHWPIVLGQAAAEDDALDRARTARHPLLVLDTDLLSTVAYCHHYTRGCDADIERMARQRLADHYLLLDIDVPWIPDGVRDRGDRREEVHALFVSTLDRFGAPYTLIGGSWSERLAAAIRVTDTLLHDHP
jgi:nicotinamide riboside kinase